MGSRTEGVFDDFKLLKSNFDVLGRHLESLNTPNKAQALQFDPATFKISEISKGWRNFLSSTPLWNDQPITHSMKVVLSYNLMRAHELSKLKEPADVESLKELNANLGIVKKWIERVRDLRDSEIKNSDNAPKIQYLSDLKDQFYAFEIILNTFGCDPKPEPVVASPEPLPVIPAPPPSSGFRGFKPRKVEAISSTQVEAPKVAQKPDTSRTTVFHKLVEGASQMSIEHKRKTLNPTGIKLEVAQDQPTTERTVRKSSLMAPAEESTAPKTGSDAKEKTFTARKVTVELSDKAQKVRQRLKERPKSEMLDPKNLMQSFASELTASTTSANIDSIKIDEAQEAARKERRRSYSGAALFGKVVMAEISEVEEQPFPMDITQTQLSGQSVSEPIAFQAAVDVSPTSNFISRSAPEFKALTKEQSENLVKARDFLHDSILTKSILSRRMSMSGKTEA